MSRPLLMHAAPLHVAMGMVDSGLLRRVGGGRGSGGRVRLGDGGERRQGETCSKTNGDDCLQHLRLLHKGFLPQLFLRYRLYS